MPLLVACPKCKRKLKIADDTVGKKLKCSNCDTVFAARGSVPAASGSRPPAVEPPDRRRPTRSATAKEPRSEADEEPRRPAGPTRQRRGKKKSNAVLYVVLGVLLSVFLVVGLVIGGFIWLAHKTKKTAEEIAYTPPKSMPQGAPPAPPPQPAPPAGRQPQPQPAPPAGAPKAGMGGKVLAGFDWKPFKDPNGRYTVLMPRTPKEEGANIFAVTAIEFGDLKEGVYSYSFDIHYDKRENEERTLEEQIKDWREANTDSEFKPLKDQSIQVKGHSGWEIVYKKSQPQKAFVRRWFVKLKQGVALVSVDVPDTPDWIAAAEKFFASFTPLDAPPQASVSPPPFKQCRLVKRE